MPIRRLLRLATIVAFAVQLVPLTFSAPALAEDSPALELRVVTQFTWVWDDQGTGASRNGAFHSPNVPPGYCALGHLAVGHYSDPNTDSWMVVAKALEPDALAHPTGFGWVWNGTGNRRGSFWVPTPPAGYVCLGDVSQLGATQPDPSSMCCVREDLAIEGMVPRKTDGMPIRIWDDQGSGLPYPVSIWPVVPWNDDSRNPQKGIIAGTFAADSDYDPPSRNLYTLKASAVSKLDLTAAEFEELVQNYGPIIRMHPDEQYFPDDPVYVLDRNTELCRSIVDNEKDYWTFQEKDVTCVPTNADSLKSDAEDAESDPRSSDPDYRYYLKLGDDLKPGSMERARAYVRVKPWNKVFVEIQFWIFYPYNGAGKGHVVATVKDAITSSTIVSYNYNEQLKEFGRHYGDWEVVTERFARDPFAGDLLKPALLYTEAHGDGKTKPLSAPSVEFSGGHPVVYSASSSHGGYFGPGNQYYKEQLYLRFPIPQFPLFLLYARVEALDQTKAGPELHTYLTGKHELVSSEWAGIPATSPGWLSFTKNWGQYTPNWEIFTFPGDLPYVGDIELYSESEVKSGPSGPTEKPIWKYTDPAPPTPTSTSTTTLWPTTTSTQPASTTTTPTLSTTTTTLTLSDFVARMGTVLPEPATATGKAKRAAKKLGNYERRARNKIEKGQSLAGRKQRRFYKKARKYLIRLLKTARKADKKGRLGVPLEPIEEVVGGLLERLPVS